MQIVVVSDSHGRNEVFSKLRELHPNASAYISCGDTECSEEYLDGFVTVQGNNDHYEQYPKRLVLNVDGLRILVMHGDRIPPLELTHRLSDYAIAEDCQLMCYGHSHIFHVETKNGVLLVNPGSIYYNRDYTTPSYALITYENGNFHVDRLAIDEPKQKKKGFFARF